MVESRSRHHSGHRSVHHPGRHSRRHHSLWRPGKGPWIWFGTAAVALGVVLFFVRHREWADFYALNIYPRWSGAMSWLTGWIPFSLDEVLVVAAVAGVVVCLVRFRRRWMALLALLMWLAVWFYAGWGINYFRSDIYARAGVKPVVRGSVEIGEAAEFGESAESAGSVGSPADVRFEAFLRAYTSGLNESYVPVETIDRKALALEIKEYYGSVPERFGLAEPRPWQRPKRLIFSRL